MTPLTPARLAAVYECLRAFPPFSGWGLPHSSQVKFTLSKRKDCQAEYTPGEPHWIMVSLPFHHHYSTLHATMAHEMIHLYQDIHKRATSAQHNADFKAKSKTVCRKFGFDLGQFIGG